MRKQFNIYQLCIFFYILMTLIANDLLIPSFLCTVSIGFLVVSTILYSLHNYHFVLIKLHYKMFAWYGLFVLVSVISILYSINRTIVNDSSYLLYTTAILLFCFCTMVDSYEKVIRVMESYAIGAAILFGILVYTGNLVTGSRLGESFTNNSNTFAMFMIISFFFTGWLFLYHEKRKTVKALYAIILIMEFISILLSGARKTLFASVVYMVILLLFRQDGNGRKHIIKNLCIAGGIIAIVCYLILNNAILYNIIGERMQLLLLQFLGKESAATMSSAYLRKVYRKLALQGWLRSPIWGHGYDSFRYLNNSVTGHNAYSHNNYTELLYNTGIIGFLVYYSAYFKIIKNSIGSADISSKALSIAGIVGICICEYGQVDYNLIIVVIFLFVLHKVNLFANNNNYAGVGRF